MLESAISVSAAGINITTGVASANATLPNTSSGTRPNYIRVAATANARIRLGIAGVAATATDMLLMPSDQTILKVSGYTTIAAIQDTAAGVVSVVALEDL